MNEQGSMSSRQLLPRIGLVATDTLREFGLRSLLDDGQLYEIVPVAGPDERVMNSLGLVVIASVGDDGLFALLASFRRTCPGMRLLVMGPHTDLEHLERVIDAGAKGYVHHTVSEVELRTAIEEVCAGSIWAPHQVLVRLLEHSQADRDGATGQVHFTKREVEVLHLLILGQPNRQIASALGVDEGTVKAHMSRLMRKAGVDNRTALSMRVLQHRWVQ